MAHIRGDRVKVLRERRDMTQLDLCATPLGIISQSHLSKIERGMIDSVGSYILEHLARELGTNVDYLVGSSDDPRPGRYVKADELTPDEQAFVELYRKIKSDVLRDSAHNILASLVAADAKTRPVSLEASPPLAKSQSPPKG